MMEPYTNRNMVKAADHCVDSKCEGCPFEDFLTGERHARCRDILICRLGTALDEYIELAEQLNSSLSDILEKVQELKER